MSKIKILLVEDELNIVVTLMRALQRELGVDAEISVCATAEDALALLNSENFDLLLTDDRLPGLSGSELIGQLHALPVSPKVILMTATPLEIDLDNSTSSGAFIYLIKPFRLSVLINHIYELLEPVLEKGQSYASR